MVYDLPDNFHNPSFSLMSFLWILIVAGILQVCNMIKLLICDVVYITTAVVIIMKLSIKVFYNNNIAQPCVLYSNMLLIKIL